MKYFLVIGILYKFYREPGDITIHVGGKFIDTFQLDQDFTSATDIHKKIDTRWYKKHGKEHWLTREDWVERWKGLPSLYKVYEIDDSIIEDKVKIKVVNSQSDYTNGFMKNNSQIRFSVVSIFQKDLTKNRGEKFMDRLIQLDRSITELGENSSMVSDNRWPVAETFYVTRENEIYQKSGIKDHTWWIGGSFTADFDIQRKKDDIYIGLTHDREWFNDPRNVMTYDLILASCDQLLNIYDEDQRSNNTKN